MKIGDKVRYLNAVGGGVVTGFKGKDIAIVDDEGFDTPVLIRECVVIEPANELQVRQSVKPTEQYSSQTISLKTLQEEEPLITEETKEGDQITVFLAFLPLDIKQLNSTGYECYLINESNYYLSYVYMNRTAEAWNCLSVGVIEPNTKIFIEEFDKTDLNDRERVCLQFVAYKKKKVFAIKNSYSVELRMDTVKFYKLHSFRENDYFEEEAIIYPLVKKDLAERELQVSALDLQQAMMQKQQADRRATQPIKKQKTASQIVEIDLHITELLDNTNGLTNKEMLDYQLDKFNEVMGDNLKQKGQKIVFIHGKGDGVLKNALLKELNEKYKHTAYYQDASFREYGFGATMVTIK